MNPQPGEIWLADLGLAAKTRPVVIVSRQDPDPPRDLVLYVPLTTQRRNSPYEVPLPRLQFLDRESVANVQGVTILRQSQRLYDYWPLKGACRNRQNPARSGRVLCSMHTNRQQPLPPQGYGRAPVAKPHCRSRQTGTASPAEPGELSNPLASLPTLRLERRIGRLSAEIMERLKDALAFALDLHRASD